MPEITIHLEGYLPAKHVYQKLLHLHDLQHERRSNLEISTKATRKFEENYKNVKR